MHDGVEGLPPLKPLGTDVVKSDEDAVPVRDNFGRLTLISSDPRTNGAAEQSDPADDIDGEDPEAFEKELAAIADQEAEHEAVPAAELTFDERVERVLGRVFAHPELREIRRDILAQCTNELPQTELEAWIAGRPDYPADVQTPVRLIESLVDVGGLTSTPRLKSGEAATEEALDAMSDEDFYEQFDDCYIQTTPEGREAVQRTTPEARITELRHAHPLQDEGYEDVLRFIAEEPRSRYDIERFCVGKPYLTAASHMGVAEVRPSHFIDKLERAGVIVWQGKWTINDAGTAYLASLNSNK